MKNLRHLLRRVRPLMSRNAQESSKGSDGRSRLVRQTKRRLLSETLEQRQLLAGDFGVGAEPSVASEVAPTFEQRAVAHNYFNRYDVDNNGSVTPLDALRIINHLNSNAEGEPVELGALTTGFVDVNEDSNVTPLDALMVINRLNAEGEDTPPETEDDFLVQFRIQPRDLDDNLLTRVGTFAGVNETGGTLPGESDIFEIEQGEIFKIEVGAQDTRGRFDRDGLFQSVVDVVIEQSGAIEPVIGEVQGADVPDSLFTSAAPEGTLTFFYENDPSRTFVTSIEDFVGNSDSDTARVVANAIATINDDVTVDEFGNTEDISVTAGVRPESGFYQFRVAYTALDLAGQQIPRLITELRFGDQLQQESVVIIEDDVVVNGQFNPDALRGNLEVFTRNFNGARPAVGNAQNNGDFEGAGETLGEQFYGTLRSGRFIVNPGGADVFDEIGVSGGISTAADEIGPLDPTVFYDTFSIIVRAVTPTDGVVIRAEAAPERDAIGDLPVFEGVLLYGSDAGDEQVAVENLRFDEDAQFQLRITSTGADTITAPNAVLTINEDTTGAQNTNASSTNGGAIQYAIVGTSAQGSATIDANGQITYVPNANAFGSDTVTYSATIPGTTPLLTATGTLNVTITPVNDEPIANDDNGGTATVGQAPILIPVLANDDAGGMNEPLSELTVSVTNTGADAPTLGTVAVVNDGSNGTFVQYTPLAGAASGTDTFTYTISDGEFSDTAVVTVNVVNNSLGVSADDFTAAAIDEDSDAAVVVDLIAQGLLTAVTGSNNFVLDSFTSNQGTVTANGLVLSFEPNDNFNGNATITYTVSNDVPNGADSGVITIPVTSINDNPVAFDLDFDINERSVDFPLNILQLGVGQAPTDVEDADSSLTVQLPGGVSVITLGNNEGTVTVDSNNVLLVTLTTAAPQDDLAFNYEVVDSLGGIGTATISLDIQDVQDPPTADNATVAGTEDGANISVDLDTLGNAENNLTISYSVVSFDADDLTAAPTIDANNNLIIDPALNFNGTTTVTYRATVGNQFAEGVITVNVASVNDDPTVPSPIARTVLEDSQIDIDILSLASDVDDGDTLSAAVATNPSNGTVVPQGNGVFRYIPAANFNGSDSFTVTVSDGNGGSATTTINMTVTDTVAIPVANDGSLNAVEDGGAVTLDLNNLVDLDPGDSATITLTTGASNGNATITNGILSYTPNANFNGSDSIVYTATNATGSDTGTITISVSSVNDNPVANDDSAVTSRGNAVTIDVLANDIPDPANEGESVTVSVEAGNGPSNGSVTITNNTITYTPNADFADAVDTFTYTLTDSSGGTDTAVVTVTVNDFPTSSVSGQLFQDSADNIGDVIENGATPAGNGIRDAGEIGLGGVAVRLQSTAGSNASGEAVDVIAITDRDGNFVFNGVPIGIEYTLTYALPTDVVLMDGSSRSLTFAVTENAGGVPVTANLGLAGIGSLALGGYSIISTAPRTEGLPEGIEEDEQSSFLFTADAAFGLAQSGFVAGEGFDGIEYLELSLSSDGTQALLTTIDVNSGDAVPTVRTAVVDSEQLQLQSIDDGSVRARLFGTAEDFNFVDDGDIGDLADDFPAYRAAIDEILASL